MDGCDEFGAWIVDWGGKEWLGEWRMRREEWKEEKNGIPSNSNGCRKGGDISSVE